MKRRLYPSLALQGLLRNRRTTLPYLLSCTGIAMMYFMLLALAGTDSLTRIYGARTLRNNLEFGSYVMMIFSAIVVFYTHSFLMRQRKKELGLFSVLGMEKRHIGRVLLLETLVSYALTTGLGLLLGRVFSRLLYLVLLRLLGSGLVPQLHIPMKAYWGTALLFQLIHGLTLLNALRQLALTRPIELLRGQSLGEKEPKARIWLAVFGLLALGGGYAISLTATEEVIIFSVQYFFIAVLLVIAGTYALFLAGSVSLLKALRRNKKFYYTPKHFPVVAGLIHRMKRNATGLATICILSTMVLVMISTTASLFVGTAHAVREQQGRDAVFRVHNLPDQESAQQAFELIKQKVQQHGLPQRDAISYRTREFWVAFNQQMDRGEDTILAQKMDGFRPYINGPITLVVAEDYAQATGRQLKLAPFEVLAFSPEEHRLPARFSLLGQQISVKEALPGFYPISISTRIINTPKYLLVMNQGDIDTLDSILNDASYAHSRRQAEQEGRSFMSRAQWDASNSRYIQYYAFDTGRLGTERIDAFQNEAQTALSRMDTGLNEQGVNVSFQHSELVKAEFNAMFGGLLFVAVFLGLLFMMAMVLIIYYKQVSEGYEDAARFTILRQVGMSREEVKRAIKSQVLLVFFLPLLAAGIHSLMAFNILRLMLGVFELNNARLYALVTLATFLVFSLIYLGIYLKTAQTYNKIVNPRSLSQA